MRNRGFSFIEVMVASMLTILLMGPLVALFRQSNQETQQSLDELLAMMYARETVEHFQTIIDSAHHTQRVPIGNHKDTGWVDFSQAGTNTFLFGKRKIADHNERVIKARSLVFLRPIPPNYRRLVRFYPSNAGSPDRYLPDPHLYTLDVRIEWKTLTSQHLNRSVELTLLIDRNEVTPR